MTLAVGVLLPLTAAAGDEAHQIRVTVLHTSDLHGATLPIDDYADRPSKLGSLAQAATLVEQVRAAGSHPVLVLDSGDTIQGTPFEQLTTVRWGEPSPTIATMNRIGYQAMAVGNHEFNFGLDVLRRVELEADFPFLAANCIDATHGEPAFPPYTTLEAGPVKIGVLGLITPNVPGWETPEHYAGLEFEPMDEAARHWVPILRDTAGCDLVIVLAHCGFERDLEHGELNDTGHENFGWRLTQVPGIDVLLTGHTHRDIPPREVNGVIVSQPAARGARLTRLDLELEREADGWRIDSWSGANLVTAEAEAAPEIMEALAPVHERVARALDATVGEVTAEVRVDRCRLEDCAATDLLHAVQLEASGADLSLAALPNRYAPPLSAGPVSLRWVYAFYTYPNTLTTVRLTGSQVRDLLEHTARYYDGLRCEPEDGCTVLTDPEVRHYNVDTMAGVSYRIDPTRPEGSRVRDLSYRGLPLAEDAIVSVVVNSYRAAGGGLYPHLAEADTVWRSSAEMTDLIADYLQRHRPWQPVSDGNWWLGRDMVAEEEVSAP